MSPGERFRGAVSSGVAEFLASHQACDAGFDIKRDRSRGSGRLRITCKGCGQSVDYLAAEMAAEPPVDHPEAAADGAGAPAAPSPQPVSAPGAEHQPEPDGVSRRRGLAGWLPSVLILAGEEIAVMISAGGYSFLLTLRKQSDQNKGG